MLLFLYIFLLLTSPVSADNFNDGYNCRYNLYRQTTGISYSYLPTSKNSSEEGFSYDISLVEGVETEDVRGNYSLESLTEISYWQRKSDLLSRVSGPPGTQVDLLYYYLNDISHGIEVNKILLPFSRGDSSLGNWMNVVMGVTEVSQRDISFLWGGSLLSRGGLMKEYEGPGQIGSGIRDSLIMDRFVIKDPIEEKTEMLANGQKIEGKITLRNLKNEDLENIEISHGSFNSTYTIPAMDTVEIEYSLNEDEWGDILTISNPNFARECILYGNSSSDWTTTDAITALAFREDGGWVNGSYLKPEGEDFCITQIPYSENILLSKPQIEEEEEGMGEDMDEDMGEDMGEDMDEGTEEDSEEILNENNIVYEDNIVLTDDSTTSSDNFVEEGEVLGVQANTEVDSIKDNNNDNNFVLPKTAVVIY